MSTREILFRGKRIDNGEWVEGYYCVYPKGNAEISKISRKCDNPPDCDPMWKRVLITYEVDPETVCQCTGLTDKDGRKIFKGDILSAHLDDQQPEDITYVQITWNGVSWCMREREDDDVMDESDIDKWEVAGNIFDNPELLN